MVQSFEDTLNWKMFLKLKCANTFRSNYDGARKRRNYDKEICVFLCVFGYSCIIFVSEVIHKYVYTFYFHKYILSIFLYQDEEAYNPREGNCAFLRVLTTIKVPIAKFQLWPHIYISWLSLRESNIFRIVGKDSLSLTINHRNTSFLAFW